jgi:hypothetical protein
VNAIEQLERRKNLRTTTTLPFLVCTKRIYAFREQAGSLHD